MAAAAEISDPPFDLAAFLASCHVQLPPEYFLACCRRLYGHLIDYNSKVNLTRITSPDDFWIKHVADSLLIGAAFPGLTGRDMSVADLGCGGGFPSLALAIAYPAWRITAIDSIRKKTAFVALAAEKLKLNNVEVVTGRGRELNRQPRFQNRFDVVTARAVGRSPALVFETDKFPRKRGGMFIFYKTPEQAQEDLASLDNSASQWRVSPEFSLPCDKGSRLFLYSST